MSWDAASAERLQCVGRHDLGGFGDGMQLLRHHDALYVGHHGVSGMGTSILDVADPTAPRLVRQWNAPEGMHTHKVQVGDGLLLINHERFPPRAPEPPRGAPAGGLAVYRLDDPFDPQQVGFWESSGRGVHRVVYMGGRFAYLSATPDGFLDRMWIVLDLLDPANPVEAGRWWWPGQWAAAGEDPTWPQGARFAAHHALLDDHIAYLGYDDANLVVLDVANPARPALLANLRWEGGSTHTCLPLPGRRLVVTTDEQVHDGPQAPVRTIRLVDVANPTEPFVISTFPSPDVGLAVAGARFGAHNLHENRPGSYRSERLLIATYFAAGVRVYDVSDAARPEEVAHWVPWPAQGKPAAQTNDIFVDLAFRFYASDRVGGGVAILEPDADLSERMAELAS